MNKTHLTLVHWNAQSLEPKSLDFSNFLITYDIDIAMVSETWLKPCNKLNIPNYTCIRSDRLTGPYGSTAI